MTLEVRKATMMANEGIGAGFHGFGVVVMAKCLASESELNRSSLMGQSR